MNAKQTILRVAVLASGNGSNFEAIVRAQRKGKLGNACVCVLITDKQHAFARIRARRLKVKEIFLDAGSCRNREHFDKKIIEILRKERIGLIALAGYMRLLSPSFIKVFRNRIVNVHPALLPAFKGTHAIEKAYAYGVTVTGVTVHFVDEHLDHGPIILQGPVSVSLEHRLYPEAIRLFAAKRLKLRGRKVIIRG